MSKIKFDELMSNPAQKLKRTRDVLMRIFWYIVHEENITLRQWNRSIREYVNDPKNLVNQEISAKTEHRSNLRGALVKDTLSWMFFNRAIKALGIKRAEIIFRYSFDEEGDNMKEFKIPMFTLTRSDLKNEQRESEPAKADNGRGRAKR